MDIQIEVISVSHPEFVPNGKGGGYNFIEIAHKQQGNIKGKKLFDFANPDIYKRAQKFGVGEVVNLEIIKNDKGFWNWTKIYDEGDIHEQDSHEQETTTKAPTNTNSGRVTTVSNYDKSNETRQQMIIRQSSIASAVALAAANGGKKNTPEDIVNIAKVFVDFANDKKPIKEDDGSVEAMENDII